MKLFGIKCRKGLFGVKGVVKVIEEAGAVVVVVYENCTGAKQLDRQCPEEGNPMTNIAGHYFRLVVRL